MYIYTAGHKKHIHALTMYVYLDMACRYNLAMLVMASFRMLHWERGRKNTTHLVHVTLIPHTQLMHTPPTASINTIKFLASCPCDYIVIDVWESCSSLLKQALLSDGGMDRTVGWDNSKWTEGFDGKLAWT